MRLYRLTSHSSDDCSSCAPKRPSDGRERSTKPNAQVRRGPSRTPTHTAPHLAPSAASQQPIFKALLRAVSAAPFFSLILHTCAALARVWGAGGRGVRRAELWGRRLVCGGGTPHPPRSRSAHSVRSLYSHAHPLLTHISFSFSFFSSFVPGTASSAKRVRAPSPRCSRRRASRMASTSRSSA